MANEFSVNQWGSHPDEGNDDCFTGTEHDTLEEALKVYQTTVDDCYVMYLQLDGPGVHQIRKNPGYNAREIRIDQAAERSERAMQSGMAFGCQGYNEEMGYD